MKREVSTDHIHYDPISGYIHKFRLDRSEDVAARTVDLPLFVAGVVAIGLMLVIGAFTL